MTNKSAALRLFFPSLLCWLLISTLSQAQTVANKQQVLRQARNAYYNLRDEGLVEFACTVTPNWEALLAEERKTDPRADAAIKTLSQLQFNATLGTDGKVKLTHNDLPGQSEEMNKALRQMDVGMQQVASEILATWSRFMLEHPFPELAGEYQLEAPPQQYRLSYKDGDVSIVTTTDRDFAISNLKATVQQLESSIQPKFTRTPKGFLLTAYDTSYKSASPEDATQLSVLIGYQEVNGLQLVKQLNLNGTYRGNPFAVELAFSDCKVTKKQ